MDGIDHVDHGRRHFAGNGQGFSRRNRVIYAFIDCLCAYVKGRSLICTLLLVYVEFLLTVDRTPVFVVNKGFLHGAVGVFAVHDILHLIRRRGTLHGSARALDFEIKIVIGIDRGDFKVDDGSVRRFENHLRVVFSVTAGQGKVEL